MIRAKTLSPAFHLLVVNNHLKHHTYIQTFVIMKRASVPWASLMFELQIWVLNALCLLMSWQHAFMLAPTFNPLKVKCLLKVKLPQSHSPMTVPLVPWDGPRVDGTPSHSSDCDCPELCLLWPKPTNHTKNSKQETVKEQEVARNNTFTLRNILCFRKWNPKLAITSWKNDKL